MKAYKLTKQNEAEYFAYIDQDDRSHENPEMWFWTEILGGCGCGHSDSLAARAVRLLDFFATPHDQRDLESPDSPYNGEASEVLAHWMDSKKLIEHGGGVGGSWLTDDGQQIYDILKSFPAVHSPTKRSKG